jgi:hypothetical protein
MELRSYRAVFDLERRIYRVDRLRLPPGGVPVRGIVYFFGIVLCGALLSAAPGVGQLASALPWYLRTVAIPGALASLLAILRIDGRPFHIAALALLSHVVHPRLTLGCGRPLTVDRWRPHELLLLPDGSEHRMRRMSYEGPGGVLVAKAHERWEPAGGVLGAIARRPQLMLREMPGRRLSRPQLIELAPGARLQVR